MPSTFSGVCVQCGRSFTRVWSPARQAAYGTPRFCSKRCENNARMVVRMRIEGDRREAKAQP